ncbi:tetratricopeptide repeat protein [Qipengyuania gelatinilytica]|uniref:Tetratricopeptide repeat protein n=1 Tax=Qipengyuania gelatinilytica TaxID=2867231 RepID=A0ABX9A3N6_9SPHN|nr:tetratricopeptide repeat protein [Qipengyuania gelatinilytica]QZD95876.1 tetratricopeptide repeat protein [Qipengyuania gelatinilytica]
MARTPKTEPTREEKKAKAEAAEQEALLREVDDAVRQGDLDSFLSTYGKPLLGLVILGLAAFGGYIYWQNQQEKAIEASSEQLVLALEKLSDGDEASALSRLAQVDGKGSAVYSAKMVRAGLIAQDGDNAQAIELFGEVANAEGAPEEIRNLALIRMTALQMDTITPEDVVAAMQPLAAPGEPFFASAGELLGHAYLEQGKRDEAAALFAEIARDENTPMTARARMLNLASSLGVNAVDDVQELLDVQGGGSASPTLVNE